MHRPLTELLLVTLSVLLSGVARSDELHDLARGDRIRYSHWGDAPQETIYHGMSAGGLILVEPVAGRVDTLDLSLLNSLEVYRKPISPLRAFVGGTILGGIVGIMVGGLISAYGLTESEAQRGEALTAIPIGAAVGAATCTVVAVVRNPHWEQVAYAR